MKNIMSCLLIAATMLCLLIYANRVQAIEEATDDNKECATCHVMWLSDFQNKNIATLVPFRDTPVEKSGRENDVASNERMCFTCHDGYVLDSRFRWRKGSFNHPVGGKVPKKIHIPNIDGKETFPLNLDKRIYCGTCHSAHGVDWSQNRSAVFMRAVNESSNMCRACHADHASGPKEGNHPILDRMENFPQVLLDAGSKIGPGQKVVCESCHRQHGAPAKKLLVIKNSGSSSLCRTCHGDKRGMVKTKHDLSILKPNAKNGKGQTVRESGLCSTCHVPHGAKGPALASEKFPAGSDPLSASCINCHNPKGVAKKATINKHSHPLNVSVTKLGIKVVNKKKWTSTLLKADSKFKLTPLPLFDKNGQRHDDAKLLGCGSCHDPHVWSPLKLQQKNTNLTKLKGDGNSSFLRIAQGKNSKLCINCHIDKSSVIASRHNPSVFKPEKAKLMTQSGKKKMQFGVCGACHKAHNGYGAVMWSRNKGSGKTAIEKMCTDCHNDKGVAKDQLTGKHSHPVGKKLSKTFSSKILPQFSTSGKRVKRGGNIDCASCHDPHQWDPKNMGSREGANLKKAGNGNNSFLRIRADTRASLCVNCHKTQVAVRATDHDMAVTAPTSWNKKRQTVRQSGLCGQCHAVHNAESSTGLWGRELGNGKDVTERLCRSCHDRDKIASDKTILPELTTHPDDVLVWSSRIREKTGLAKQNGSLLVFDQHGKRANVGKITCSSCHNPHIWSTRKAAKAGTGKNLEGDSTSSFLVLKSSANSVCGDCHGQDAIFRYKYYHSKSARKEHALYK